MAAIRDQPDGTLVYNPTWPVHVSAIQVDHQRPRPIAPLSARVLPNVKQGVCFYDKSSYGAPTQSRPSTTLTSMHSNHPAMFAVRFLPVAPVESRRCAVPGRRPDPECIHVTDAANRRRRTSPHVQRLSRCPQRLFRSASLAGIPTRTHARHRRTVTERRSLDPKTIMPTKPGPPPISNHVPGRFPPLLFLLTNVFAYSVYLGFYGLNAWRSPGTSSWQIFALVAFHMTYAMMIICYLRMIITKPGSVPDTPFWACTEDDNGADRFLFTRDEVELMSKIVEPGFFPCTEPLRQRVRQLPFVELKQSIPNVDTGPYIRKCVKCQPPHFKPDRTHHCSRLGQCVLAMDHFCAFANTTVGFYNRKFFVLFLVYAFVSTVLFLVTFVERAKTSFSNAVYLQQGLGTDIPVVCAFLAVVVVSVGLLPFTLFHLYAVLNAVTTIEFREKHGSSHADIRRRSLLAHVKFDKGYYGNVVDVFGTQFYFWLLPVQSDFGGANGLYCCRDEFPYHLLSPSSRSWSGTVPGFDHRKSLTSSSPSSQLLAIGLP